ncbi:glyoxalase superfamily protein [Curtobacterium sp. MCBA15_013]|uniref:glyoxalase superfamily protein n=1 Tax=Curtobacterium sp. MCBA15_013 TaxID=1898739 RepID=UPI0008DE4ABD|nr:glyoxalase superfamily protein [Curtobacterium sp. MCBA15_013]OII24454.1 hypothetical protein BIV01_14385 [Curtobacterium sp. MCBA15_013]
MITIEEAKRLARELSTGTGIPHSKVLEAAAHAAGLRDWNTLAALHHRQDPEKRSAPRVIPVLRVFDHAVARAFYCDYLGFEWEWQHRFEPDLPVYAQVSLDGKVLHLTEHHGDATPGGAVMLVVDDVAAYRDALLAQRHPRSRPGLDSNDWGRTMLVIDPFGNRLQFWEPYASSRS